MTTPPPAPLATELDRLAQLPVPDGANPAEFELLRAELRTALAGRVGSAINPVPPLNDRSRTQLSWDEDTATLTWYYYNNGDYDQNGEVNASDLTPLGAKYGVKADLAARSVFDELVSGPGASPFGTAASEAVIDGDVNGEIGITDVTPIGQNFHASVTGYRVYAGTAGGDFPATNGAPSTLNPLGEVAFTDAQGAAGEGRLSFSFTVASPVAGDTYWVRPVYRDAEGTPSTTAGPGLTYASGQLALTAISPASAEPGELVWLEFNRPLTSQLAGLTIVVNGLAETETAVADLALSNNLAGTAAPLLAPGLVTFEAFQDGTSIGTVQLELLAAATARTVAQTAQEFDTASAELSNLLYEYVDWLQYTPGYDLAAAEAELADFTTTLNSVVDYFLEELNALNPEDQAAVLAYLENSGYFDLVGSLDAHPHGTSRAVSVAYERNWQYLSTDMWSAAATNNAMVMDLIGVGTAIVTEGATVPAVVAAKVLLSIFDSAIDTYIPTDLYDLRVSSKTRLLDSGQDYTMTVEGLFAAEKPAINGTLELFIDVALANLKLPESKLNPLRQALINDLGSKIGGQLVKEFWTAVLPVVDDPESPCDGRIGGWWQRLDLYLYSSLDWDVLKDKVLYHDYYYWLDQYYGQGLNAPYPAGVVSVEPDWVDLKFGRFDDILHFNTPDKYLVTIRCFSFSDTQANWWLWSHTGLKGVELVEPYWVGRWGDWKNTQISHNEVSWTEQQYLQLVNGIPVCIYPVYQGSAKAYEAIHATNPDATTWSQPVKLLDYANVLEMTVLGGKPALLFSRDDEKQLLIANDALGASWPELGTVVANTLKYSGSHSGAVSNNLLVDDTASFVSAGIEANWWVQLDASGNYAKIQSVLSETKLSTSSLPTGEVYSPGAGYTIYQNDVRDSECRLGASGGVPALIYWPHYSANLTETHYVIAKDTSGEEWNDPVLAGQDSGYRSQPIFSGGNPGYASWFYDQGVYFRQATDPAGTGWGARELVAANGSRVNAVAPVNGYPALCFVTTVDLPPGGEVNQVDELYFTMGEATGGSWQSPVRIGRAMEQDYWTSIGKASLAVIGGVPAVAYSHFNGSPAYVKAQDSSGWTWGDPQPILYGNTGSIHLCELNGSPAVCHFSLANDAMWWSVPDL